MKNKTKIEPFQLVSGEAWAITKEGLSRLISLSGKTFDDIQSILNMPPNQGNSLLEMEADGVARIDITGALHRYDNVMTRYFGDTSYESIGAALDLAMESREVKSIILNIDSPGGIVTGLSELGEKIRAASEKKPITAYVGGMAASAAYWLASSTKSITMGETSVVGSIGTYVAYLDDSGWMEQNGLKELVFRSSQSPKKNLDPASEEGKAQIQAYIDTLGQMFVETVARNRKTSADDVLQNYGQGDIVVGAEAVKRGMADKIGYYDTALTKAINFKQKNGGYAMTVEQLKAEFPDVAKALMDEGAAVERQRIQSIEELAGSDNSEVVSSVKYDGKTTAEQTAVLILKAEQKKKADLLEKIVGDAAKIPSVEQKDEQAEGEEKKGAVNLLLKAAEKHGRLK